MALASVAEIVAQLRGEGKTDDEVAVILERSRVALPPGNWHHWTRIAVRAAVGEDASGGVLR